MRRNAALLLLVVATAVVAGAFYVGGAGATPSDPAAPASDPAATRDELVDGDGMREVVDLRTRFSRTFEATDGSRVTRMWQDPINYRQPDGDLVPIDATLEAQPDGSVETEATDYELQLPETIDDPVEVSHDGASVEFKLQGADAAGSVDVDGEVATFEDALPGVDAVYTAQSDSVKEDLVLASLDAQRSFSFTLEPSAGVTPEINDAGGVDFVDAQGDVPIAFAPPVMADAAGATSTDLEYELAAVGPGRWRLDLDADTPWLRDPERTFPVRVDPTTYFGLYQSLNTHFNYKHGATSYGGTNGPLFLNAGYEPDGSTTWRTVMKMTLTGIPSSATVTSAAINLHESAEAPLQAGSPTVSVHGLTSPFTLAASWLKRDSTNNWAAPGGDFSGTAQSSHVISEQDRFYKFDITPLARTWVNGTRANHGVMVKSNSGVGGGIAAFDSWKAGVFAPWMEVKWLHPDTDGPDITVSGAFADATDDGPRLTAGASYALTAEAQDFDDRETVVSGTTRLEILIDGVSKAVQTARNCTSGCDMRLGWTLNTAAYPRGEHDLEIVAIDAKGNRSEERVEWETHKYREPQPSVTRDLTGATRINGATYGDGAGTSTAPAGDLDYDGYNELLVGAPGVDLPGRADAGSVYVVRGTEPGATLNLANSGTVLLRINGASAGERAGSSVANIGDVNDDLIDDWAIGAPAGEYEAPPNARGRVYVVFGRETGGTVDLANLGSGGYRILGPAPNYVSYPSQAGPISQPFGTTLGGQGSNDDEQQGDVNGDGTPDLAIGYSAADNGTGRAYVVFGKASTSDVDVTALGSRGFAIAGGGAAFRAGHSVAIPGDLNGDNYADVAVAQPSAGPANTSDANRAGGIGILYGAAAPANVALTPPLAAARGYLVAGAAGDRLTAVGSIGDVDGDGLTDVGYAGALSGGLYGRTSGAARLRTASDGFWATQSVAAASVNGIGDVNGDDIADLAVGSPASGPAGSSTVIFGDQETSNLGPLTAIGGHQGRTFTPPAGTIAFGEFVDGADDVSGDAVDDFVLAAPRTTANGRGDAGAVWILPGATHLEGDEAVGDLTAQRTVAEVRDHSRLRRIRLGAPVEYRRMADSNDPHGAGCVRDSADPRTSNPNTVYDGYSDPYRRTALKRFGSWTIENDMKASILWKGVSVNADGSATIVLDPAAEDRITAMVCLAMARKKQVRGHALLFADGNTVPRFLKEAGAGEFAGSRLYSEGESVNQRWFYQPAGTTQAFPMRDLVRDYIETVMTHDVWRTKIRDWDVVNEAINPFGGLKRPGGPGQRPDDDFWAKTLNDPSHKTTTPLKGSNTWVYDAFFWAREASDTDKARLVLNEVQVDDTNRPNQPDTGDVGERVRTARGLFNGISKRVCPRAADCPQPVGFGFQMHRALDAGAGDSPDLFKKQWKLFVNKTPWRAKSRCRTREQGQRGCKSPADAPAKPTIEVTEMDVHFDTGVSPEPDFSKDATNEDVQVQRRVFQDGAQACQEVRRCVRFTSWGITDQYSFWDSNATGGFPNQSAAPCIGDGTVGCGTDKLHRYPTLFAISSTPSPGHTPKEAYFDVTDWLGQCKQDVPSRRDQNRCDDRTH